MLIVYSIAVAHLIFSHWVHSIFVLSLSVYQGLSALKDLALRKFGESLLEKVPDALIPESPLSQMLILGSCKS